jgi:ribonucleoside-diphosphate reductase alpha chain
MQQGGGGCCDFSTLRPQGVQARGVGSIASGPVSFMQVWGAMCRTILSTSARRGAMMATLRCDHPDIEAFIAAKQRAGQLRHFNLSVLITDAFMTAG